MVFKLIFKTANSTLWICYHETVLKMADLNVLGNCSWIYFKSYKIEKKYNNDIQLKQMNKKLDKYDMITRSKQNRIHS